MNLSVSRHDEPAEQRMREVRLAQKFGVKLAGDKERMVLELDQLDQLAIRSGPTDDTPAS